MIEYALTIVVVFGIFVIFLTFFWISDSLYMYRVRKKIKKKEEKQANTDDGKD